MAQSAQVALVPASPEPERAAKGCCTRHVLHARHEAWAGVHSEIVAAAARLQRSRERLKRPHPWLTRDGGPSEEAAVQATRGAAERLSVAAHTDETDVFNEDTHVLV
ncbi:hypothetical protein CUR178_04164 [Leishmania enriettii]|uniref:Uncharacterized protein n=1 Tax=Leishmania enriettii TaxID=5663 RepID=A0A836KQ43_LEIEN|nr:hypothetical protein CUR178_04164 [Leishmania enriettii]